MKLHIPSRYAAVVAGGDMSSRFQDLFFQASLVVAADSGIYHLSSMDIVPHIFVGDFDSCTSETVEEFKRKGSRIVCLAREKSKTDTQVALEAVRNGAMIQQPYLALPVVLGSIIVLQIWI